MTYLYTLRECHDKTVGAAVEAAIDDLCRNGLKLLEIDVNEETISAQLAGYLRQYITEYDINVEYNRMGDISKQVTWNKEPELVYPDIIVHRIYDTEHNLLVVEIKKDSNPTPKDGDIRKLRAYRRELGYRHALFLRFGVGDHAGSVIECEWVEV